MRILLVNPCFPKTYWSADYAMRLTGRVTLLPPLGLLTVAALLPHAWELRLVDMNVRRLEDADLRWADAVFITGMLVQKESLHQVALRARAQGKVVVVGGPYASSSPAALAPYADCVVVGEVEELVSTLGSGLTGGLLHLPPRLQASRRPDLRALPPPRFDLLDVHAYQSMSLQWSRGCPFACEFCDITQAFGRVPRTKTPEQFCRELDAVYATGFHGSLFVVDDNFIGNKPQTRQLLGPLRAWMRAHRDPFDLYTEASINLAADDALMADMVDAGFATVFVGIETPSVEALRETRKLQNVAVDLQDAVTKLSARGLEVMGGFILGFDSDGGAAAERLHQWLAQAPIALAMVGMLIALPGTALEKRLRSEGRLLHECSGDNQLRTNFITRLDEAELLRGFMHVVQELYRPEAYFSRAARVLELCTDPPTRFRQSRRYGYACLARSLWHQGVRSTYRRAYWSFLWRVLRHAPRRLDRAIGLAIQGEHMLRFTSQDVIPRAQRALEDARRQPRVPGRAPGVVQPGLTP